MKQYAVETKFNGTIVVSAIDEFNAEELTIEVLCLWWRNHQRSKSRHVRGS